MRGKARLKEGRGDIAISDAYRIVAVIFLLVAGILAGAQLAKIAPLVDWYRDAIGMSLVAVGWLAALISFFVAFAAFPSGFLIDRFGGRLVFTASSAVLTLGGLGVALFDTPWAILAARLVEGVGYLFLVVVIPALAAEIAPPKFKGPALAVWGGFVPIGFAFSVFLAYVMLPALSPKAFLLAAILTFAVFALLSVLLLARLPRPRRPVSAGTEGEALAIRRTIQTPLMAVTAAFGFYVILSMAFFTFLPAFEADTGEKLILSAGSIALAVPVGNLLAGILVSGRRTRFIAALTALAFLAGTIAAPPFYAADDATVLCLAAVAFALSGGIVASALFALIPFIVPANGSPAVAIGFMAQVGGIATLIAPPLAGWIIEEAGWPALGWTLAIVGLLGLAAIVPLASRR